MGTSSEERAGVLKIDNLTVSYGPVLAVDGVSLSAEPGQVKVILGANGAGKSSLLNAVCGLVRAKTGEVRLGERLLSGMRAHKVARSGVIQVPEGRRVVAPLTTEENLLLGSLAAGDRTPGENDFATVEAIYELFPSLHDRRAVPAGQLSGGEQQMLALGRALMGLPRVILLDEPSMGLSPKLVDTVLGCVTKIASAGLAVLMVEQNVAALEVASYAYLMQFGHIVNEGPAEDFVRDERVVNAYLGT